MRRGARRAALLAGALAATASGGSALLRARRRRRRDYRVFILEYHDVCAGSRESEGVIGAARLRRHLRGLSQRYRFASLSQAAALLAEPGALREDLVVVTFDDGYAGNFAAAWPVLRELAVPATVFVTTGFLDGGELWFDFARRALGAARGLNGKLPESLRRLLERRLEGGLGRGSGAESAVERLKSVPPELRADLLARLREVDLPLAPPARPLTWEQVRRMQAAGIEIGCHTVAHPILSQLPPQRQEEEIHRSRERVWQETGKAPAAFAYPNGAAADFTPLTCELVRSAGFTMACTSVRGSNRPGCDPLCLRRIGIGSDPGFVIGARLSGLFDDGPRRLLGSPLAGGLP